MTSNQKADRVPLSSLRQGKFFRLVPKGYVHMVMSPDAVRFHKLDTNLIYGVKYNGNFGGYKPEKMVFPATFEDMRTDIEGEKAFNRAVGAIDE